MDALIDYISEKKYDFRSFAAVNITPEFVREIVSIREEDQAGSGGTVIQNTLYAHIQNQTGATHYSPFFIKASESHRSYWLLHLSKHPEARNEMGNIHWAESNASVTTVGRLTRWGFRRQGTHINSHWKASLTSPQEGGRLRSWQNKSPRSYALRLWQGLILCRYKSYLLRDAMTRRLLARFKKVAVDLREAKEITIESKADAIVLELETLSWDDRIVVPPQRSFWGPITGAFSKKK